MTRLKEISEKITLSMAVACTLSIVTAGYILWWALHPGAPLLPMLAVIGALIGWLVGMLATPYSKEEEKQFSEFGKVLSGIITGFVLSKAGPLIDAIVAVPEGGGRPLLFDQGVWPQLIVTFVSFLLALLFVIGGRNYWSPDDERSLREWINNRPGEKKLTRNEAIKLLVEMAAKSPETGSPVPGTR